MTKTKAKEGQEEKHDDQYYKKGLWTVEEDKLLVDYVKVHGKGQWNRIAKITGLKRCGKSCRLRWMNYLSPNVNRGNFTEEEDDLIIRLHKLLGNRWALIAKRVPGRTDNQVKNYWNSHLSKKLGIKDQTRGVGDSPSLTQSQKIQPITDQNANAIIDPCDENTKSYSIDNGTQNAVNVSGSGTQESNTTDESFINSLWNSCDDDLDLGTFFTMKGFVDGYSLI